MPSLISRIISCPYCNEHNEILLDHSAGENQQYIEDCQICCQPMVITVFQNSEGEIEVEVKHENEV